MRRGIMVLAAVLAFGTGDAYGQINWTDHDIDPSINGIWDIRIIDIDHDGDLDIVGAAKDADDVVWYENDGTQNFTRHIIDGAFESTKYVDVADFDGDGDLDIVATAAGVSNVGLINWYENDGSENFTAHVVTTNFEYVHEVKAADIDGDLDNDFAAVGTWADTLAWWQNNGSGVFTKFVVDNNFRYPYAVTLIDLDLDSDMDIIGGAAYEDVTRYMNNGSEVFTAFEITQFDSVFSTSIAVADMDGDNDLDIVTNNLWTDDVLLLVNDGGVFTTYWVDNYLRGCWDFNVADIDHDGDMDIAGAAWRDSVINWYEQTAPYTFTRHDLTNRFAYARSAIPIDLDGDGDIDIVGASERKDKIVWWESDLGPGSGTLYGRVTDTSGTVPIAGVEVVALEDTIPVAYDTTAADGYYYLSLIQGTYGLALSKQSYQDTLIGGINVTAGDSTRVDVRLRPGGGSSCDYLPGDINGDGNRIGGDVTFGVRFFKGLGPNPPDSCFMDSTGTFLYVAGDVNGNCEFRGSDITRLVAYFKGNASLAYCHFFPPPFRRSITKISFSAD